MGIVNRRNAVVGWIVLKVGKRIAKQKAKAAVPNVDPETKRPNTSLVASALGTVAGALWFVRRRRGGKEDGESA